MLSLPEPLEMEFADIVSRIEKDKQIGLQSALIKPIKPLQACLNVIVQANKN